LKHRVAHILNPFIAPATSDLSYAQPITFESMRIAREQALPTMDVELLAACYEEDKTMVPPYFKTTEFLKKSVLDYGNFEKKIRLPILAEILEKAMATSTADYIIYTNADIGLYPDFYTRLGKLLDQGYDALVLNRTRIEPLYTQPSDLEKIWAQKGKSHPGFDCFVLHRSLFNQLFLENICIGVPFIEISFSQNLFHLAKNFKLYETDHYTFHIGMEIFKNRAPREYFLYNKQEYKKVIQQLDPHLKSTRLPYSDLILPARIIRWGLHPCIPIRLALRLEWKRIFKGSTDTR
jgi:hypothetical protein